MKKQTLLELTEKVEFLQKSDIQKIIGGIGSDDFEIGIGNDDIEPNIINTEITDL